jgi:RNA polymerase sigma-70 factor (ECF subfamily)
MTSIPSPSATFDDVALAVQAQQGDKRAFTELVDRYARRVFRVARHITKNDEDAEDVLQDTFLKAYSRLNQFEGNSKFYTWLVRIAVNEALMRMRRGKNRVTVSLDQDLETQDGSLKRDLPADTEDPEESLGRTELREGLTQAIDSLSETYRPVFVLRDVDGLSTEETAEMLNLSISAVKSRLLRARLQLRQKLRRFLKKDGSDQENHV